MKRNRNGKMTLDMKMLGDGVGTAHLHLYLPDDAKHTPSLPLFNSMRHTLTPRIHTEILQNREARISYIDFEQNPLHPLLCYPDTTHGFRVLKYYFKSISRFALQERSGFKREEGSLVPFRKEDYGIEMGI